MSPLVAESTVPVSPRIISSTFFPHGKASITTQLFIPEMYTVATAIKILSPVFEITNHPRPQ